MKLGLENKRTTAAMVVLLAIALYVVARNFMGGPVTVSVDDTSAPVATTGTPEKVKRRILRPGAGQIVIQVMRSQDPSLRPVVMADAEKMEYKGGQRNPFAPPGYVAVVVEPGSPKGKVPDPTADPDKDKQAPPAPTIPLRFYGYSSSPNGVRKVFFTDTTGQDIFIGQEGDLINKRYKIVKINKNNVEVQDVINHFSQTLAMVSSS